MNDSFYLKVDYYLTLDYPYAPLFGRTAGEILDDYNVGVPPTCGSCIIKSLFEPGF